MKKIEILMVSAAALLFGSILHAGDIRVWTSRKGATLEGELLKSDIASATVVDKTGKQTVIKIEDLSIADRQYIVEYGKGDPKILAVGEVGEPEKEFKIDPATFVKSKDEKLELGTGKYEITRSEHFMIATAGNSVHANNFADAAERLWHGMAFQHMDFRKDWGTKRMLIVVAEDRKVHEATGKWYFQSLKDRGDADGAGRAANGWDSIGMNEIELPPEISSKFELQDTAKYYNVSDPSAYKKPLTGKVVHSLAERLLHNQTGLLTKIGSEGSFAFYTGHAFYKEIQLSGKVETSLGGTEGSDNLKQVSKEGYNDSWAKSLKTAVKKGEVKVELVPMLKWEYKDMSPANLALIYSYSAYMQSTPLRLSYYAAMVRRIGTSHAIPTPEEMAKLFGFDTVEAFNADWANFIKESSFK